MRSLGVDSAGADLRAPLLGAIAWVAALVALAWPPRVCLLILAALGLAGCVRRDRGPSVTTRCGWLLVGASVLASTLLHGVSVRDPVVDHLAGQQAAVRGVLTLRSDPVVRTGRGSAYAWMRAVLERVEGRGARYRVRAPVLVIAGSDWAGLPLGSTVRFAGRLSSAADEDLAGVLTVRGPPEVVHGPGRVLDVVRRVRASIREAVAPLAPKPRALVPALVDGDDGRLPRSVQDDFRTAGLTHLLAVSGTNLTLIVGFVLLVARWAGVRARGLVVVGLAGVVGFVLLARGEPSVLRAAVMGSVALLGMGTHGRRRGFRALGVAVLVLVLLDPWLARSVGFALSVSATAGILVLAPPWRDALGRWMPRPVAEAVSVPLAAQLACTPLVAAISGQVSLVAVGANVLAAPVVGPATVLGLLGGLVCLFWPWAGHLLARPAGWCADWIIAVAGHAGGLPAAALAWSSGVPAVAVLTVACAAVALLLAEVLSRRGLSLGLAAVVLVAVTVRWPTPGWPPDGWVLVACDVGQGDALVLRADGGRAVVVDAGPDPGLVDACLRRLHVVSVPLVVLTHFHADHVDGLAGVLEGRRVDRVLTSGLAEPAAGATEVRSLTTRAGITTSVATPGATGTLGPAALAGAGTPPSRLPGIRLTPQRRQRGAARRDTRAPDAADGGRGAALAGGPRPDLPRAPGRRAQGRPSRKQQAGPGPAPSSRRAAGRDLGRRRQRLRPPGAEHAAAAGGRGHAGPAHRPGRRRRRGRRHAGQGRVGHPDAAAPAGARGSRRAVRGCGHGQPRSR